MIVVALFAALLGVGVVEIFVVVKVADAIGVIPTLGLMVLDALIGTALMRSQGRAAWRRFTQALAAGRLPAREVLDGVLVLVGGAFLIAPGFVTDVFGALLLVPLTRGLVRRRVTRRLVSRLSVGAASGWRRGRREPAGRTPGWGSEHPVGGSSRPYDVEGTAVEVEREGQLPR